MGDDIGIDGLVAGGAGSSRRPRVVRERSLFTGWHHCGARWNGVSVSHCGGCHQTFTGVTAFDLHRRGGVCLWPVKAGLELKQRTGFEAWGWPDSGRWLRPGRGGDEEE